MFDFQKQLSKKNVYQWLGFFIISFFILMAYIPSLKHAPRGDQVVYLSEISGQRSLYDLAITNYDLNRKSIFKSGDEVLFRPLLYAFLGAEKYSFDYHFIFWQLTGVLLHLLVIFWFLKICLEFYVGIPALFCALSFGLFFPNIEMITWQHINAYILCLFLVLVALYHCFRLMDGCLDVNKKIFWVTLALFLGCFLYEIAIIYLLLIFIFLWFLRRDIRHKLLFILIPFLFYTASSFYNFHFIHHFNLTSQGYGSLGPLLIASLKTIGWWLYSGAFYFIYPLYYGSRLMFYREDVLVYKHLDLFRPEVLITIFIFVFIILLPAFNKLSFWQKRAKFLLLILTFILSYTLIIALRESKNIATDILKFDLYYQYIFWLFMMLLIFISIDWAGTAYHKIRFVFLGVLAVFILLYAAYSGHSIYMSCNKRALLSAPSLNLIEMTRNLIKAKSDDPGFSFYLSPHMPGNEIYYGIRKKGDPVGKQYSYMELLFPLKIHPPEIRKE